MTDASKGICRLSVVPMRKEPDYKSEMVSQVLFGEHYSVIDIDTTKCWLYIELNFDQFGGWIPVDQHFDITQDYFEQINLSDYKVSTDLSSTIYFQKKFVNILTGSILPIATNELFKLEEQIAYNGESKSLTQKREFEFLKEQLKKYLHAPYLLGGKTPFGIDASGFIQQIFKLSGYRLPRTLELQSKYGDEVKSIEEIRLGDIAFLLEESVYTALIYFGKEEYMGVHSGCVKILNNPSTIGNQFTIRRVLRDGN